MYALMAITDSFLLNSIVLILEQEVSSFVEKVMHQYFIIGQQKYNF